MTYADTSALFKVLVAEPETLAVRSFLDATKDRIVTSQLTITELMRTVARAGGSTTSAAMLLRQIDLIDLGESSLWRAGRLPSPTGMFLRSADAVHIVAAMDTAETDFLTYDRRQAQVATEHGFVVWSPGRPDDWLPTTQS